MPERRRLPLSASLATATILALAVGVGCDERIPDNAIQDTTTDGGDGAAAEDVGDDHDTATTPDAGDVSEADESDAPVDAADDASSDGDDAASHDDADPADTTDGVDDGASGDDAVDDADALAVIGFVVRGTIFWNELELPDATLLIALTTTDPATEPFVAEVRYERSELPAVYEFDGLPAGEYFLFGFLDIGPDNTWDAPGDEDYVAITADTTAVGRARPIAEDVNLEFIRLDDDG